MDRTFLSIPIATIKTCLVYLSHVHSVLRKYFCKNLMNTSFICYYFFSVLHIYCLVVLGR